MPVAARFGPGMEQFEGGVREEWDSLREIWSAVRSVRVRGRGVSLRALRLHPLPQLRARHVAGPTLPHFPPTFPPLSPHVFRHAPPLSPFPDRDIPPVRAVAASSAVDRSHVPPLRPTLPHSIPHTHTPPTTPSAFRRLSPTFSESRTAFIPNSDHDIPPVHANAATASVIAAASSACGRSHIPPLFPPHSPTSFPHFFLQFQY
eukprot:3697235-Rhodomonas_salina.1